MHRRPSRLLALAVLLASPVFAAALRESAPPPHAVAAPAPPAGRAITLVLPHALRADETVWLEVKLGEMERGKEVEIQTSNGRLLGVISPFGLRARHEAGAYPVPVPVEAISKGRVSLRLFLNHNGDAPRAPTAAEVKSVRLKIVRPAR